jgi:hypothetical protein
VAVESQPPLASFNEEISLWSQPCNSIGLEVTYDNCGCGLSGFGRELYSIFVVVKLLLLVVLLLGGNIVVVCTSDGGAVVRQGGDDGSAI